MTKKLLAVSLTLILLLLLTACSSGGRDKQIIYPIDKDPEFLDPQIISYDGAKNIIANCFEGLVTLGENGNIVPGCAESWKITDGGLTYTFILRRDCMWRVSPAAGALLGEDYENTFDARVTADDFVFAFKRALRPETKSPGAKNLYSIKNALKVHNGQVNESKLGVKAKDDYTLVISLEWADPDFLYSLLDSVCMPCNKEFFEATGGRYGLSTKYLIYNGPFYMSNWADDTAITLKRNDKYYAADSVAPSSLYFSINSEQETRLKKIEDGVYHTAPLTDSQAEQLEGMEKFSVQKYSSTVVSLLFNCKDPVFSNVNIRRAVAGSFDYEAAKTFFGTEAGGVIPSSMIVSEERYRDSAGNIGRYESSDPVASFDTGLTELGVKEADVTVLCLKQHEELVRTLMQSWQSQLGVRFNVKVEPLDAAELTDRVESGNYQMALYPLSYSSITAFNGLQRFTTDNANNVCNYADPVYDNIVSVIKTVSGKKTTIDATLAAEKHLISECVLVPVCEKAEYYGVGKGVSGIISNPTGEIFYFKYTIAK